MPERKPGFLDSSSNNSTNISTAKNLEDLMTVKKTRSRTWDRENPNHAFRGIKPEFIEKVKVLSRELDVTQSEVARAFIEDGLNQYWSGQFRFTPTLDFGRRTLFPNDLSKKNNGNRKIRCKGNGGPNWQKVVSYRLPSDNLENLKALAIHIDVPIGEVVSQLFSISIRRYENGDLCLNPQTITVKKGLF